MKKISAKQQQILDYISSYSLEHGYPPSVREIGAEMGLRSPSTVHAHLKKLQEAGYLEPNEHKSRALTPVSGPSMVPRVPILGRVTAGMPILAVEEHIGYVPFEPAAGGGEYYALRIRGDSMIGVGIMDDDLVIIRQGIIRIKLRTYVPTETARSAENEEDFRQTTADTGLYKQLFP